MLGRLFDNLEIDWGRLQGPAIEREAAKNAANRDEAGERDLPEPTLRDVRMEDLRDTRRLLVLYDRAVEAGIVKDSEHMRNEFMSLAEHALAEGTTNPCGLFVYLVKNRRFDAITLRDEDRMRVNLNTFQRRSSSTILRLRRSDKQPSNLDVVEEL
jgi:hypothetical protein